MQLGEVNLNQEPYSLQETPFNNNTAAVNAQEQSQMFERNNQAMHGSILQGMMSGN